MRSFLHSTVHACVLRCLEQPAWKSTWLLSRHFYLRRLLLPSAWHVYLTLPYARAMQVQYSHCSPSRNSFLSGRSPQSTGVYNFIDSFREAGVGANWTALPQFFKEHGYFVGGGGKVFHPGHPADNDMAYSWDEYYFKNGDDLGERTLLLVHSTANPPTAHPSHRLETCSTHVHTRGARGEWGVECEAKEY